MPRPAPEDDDDFCESFFAMSFQEWAELARRMPTHVMGYPVTPPPPDPTIAVWREQGRSWWKHIKSQPHYKPEVREAT